MNYNLTEDQLKVFSALKNIQMKERVLWFLLGGFAALTLTLVAKFAHWLPTDQSDNIILGSVDTALAIIITPLTKHFFPALKEAVNSVRKKKAA